MLASLNAFTAEVETFEFGARYYAASSLWLLLDALDQSAATTTLVEEFSDPASLGRILKRALEIAKDPGTERADALSDYDIALTLYIRFLARTVPRSAHVVAREVLRSQSFYNATRYALILDRVLGTVSSLTPITMSAVNTSFEMISQSSGTFRAFDFAFAELETYDEVRDVYFGSRVPDDTFSSDNELPLTADLGASLAISQIAA